MRDNFAADFDVWILLARVDEGNFAQRVRDFFHDRVHRKHVYLAGLRVELRTQIFLGAVIFPRRHHHRVLNGRNDDLRFDMLFPADLLDCLVQQTRHPRFSSLPPVTTPPPDSLCESRRTAPRLPDPYRQLHDPVRITRQPALKILLILHRFVQPNIRQPSGKPLIIRPA